MPLVFLSVLSIRKAEVPPTLQAGPRRQLFPALLSGDGLETGLA